MTVPPVRTVRQRLSGEERRAVIVKAARTLFAQNGFHATGTTEIAALAGCSEAIIYRHFASKGELFASALEDASAQIRERFDATVAGAQSERFSRLLQFWREMICDRLFVEVSRLRVLALAMASDPVINEALRHVSDAHRERMREVVAAGKASGEIRPDVDGDTVALLLFGLNLASGFALAVHGEEALADYGAHLDSFVRLIKPGEPA